MFHINKEENKMNYLDDRDYDDVSFIKKHPEIKGVFITVRQFGAVDLVR